MGQHARTASQRRRREWGLDILSIVTLRRAFSHCSHSCHSATRDASLKTPFTPRFDASDDRRYYHGVFGRASSTRRVVRRVSSRATFEPPPTTEQFRSSESPAAPRRSVSSRRRAADDAAERGETVEIRTVTERSGGSGVVDR